MTLNEEISWCKAQIKKGYEVVPLRSILARLQKLVKQKPPPHPYHNHCIQAYKVFLEKNDLPAVIEPRQGAALSELLPKLQTASTLKTEESAYQSFVYVLNNWKRLSNYHQKQKTLTHINQHMIEILDQIKNGHGTGRAIKNNHSADGRKPFGTL